MGEKTKALLLLCLLFATLLTATGIYAIVNTNKEYSVPVYISQEFKLYGESSKTITGQLTNRTDKTIIIDELLVHITTNTQGNKMYYDNLKFTNISIPPNGVYNVSKSGIYPSMVNASVSYCLINGEKYFLKYSTDGSIFENSNNNQSSYIMLTGGITLFAISFLIIIVYFIRKMYVKY